MKSHIEAIKAMLGPSGCQVYYVDVPKLPVYPYVLLWSGTGRYKAGAVCGERDDLDDRLGVTMVAITPDEVLTLVPIIRGLLEDRQPVVAGRFVHPLRIFDSQAVDVDLTVTLPNTNRHPGYGVDIYTLKSEPA